MHLKKLYFRLEKEERKKIKEEFFKTEFGKSYKYRLNRLFTTGLLAFIFSIILITFNQNKWDIVTAIILIIAGVIFTFFSIKLRYDKLNNYLINKKNK